MPVTPLHLGAALPGKPVLRDHLSLGVFAVVQIAIDIEPVWKSLTSAPTLHGPSHGLLVALAISAVLIVPAKYGVTWFYRVLRGLIERHGRSFVRLAAELRPVRWSGAVVAAAFGAISHVLLDAVVHADVRPFAPWTDANPLHVPGSFWWVHGVCATLGVAGMVWWLIAGRRRAQVHG